MTCSPTIQAQRVTRRPCAAPLHCSAIAAAAPGRDSAATTPPAGRDVVTSGWSIGLCDAGDAGGDAAVAVDGRLAVAPACFRRGPRMIAPRSSTTTASGDAPAVRRDQDARLCSRCATPAVRRSMRPQRRRRSGRNSLRDRGAASRRRSPARRAQNTSTPAPSSGGNRRSSR